MTVPRKLDKSTITEIEKLVLQGVAIEVAAAAVGITPTTYAVYRNDAINLVRGNIQAIKNFTPEYAELLDHFVNTVLQAEAAIEAQMAGVIISAAKSGRWGAAKYWLETRRPERWQPERAVTVTHRRELFGTTDTHEVDVKLLTTAELEQLVIEGEVIDELPRTDNGSALESPTAGKSRRRPKRDKSDSVKSN